MPLTKIKSHNIDNFAITTEKLSNTAVATFAQTLAPKVLYANVTNSAFTVLDDTAVNVSGGYIVVTGSDFVSGATVLIDTTAASSVTYVNSTTLRAEIPAKAAASYNLYVVNPDGGVGIKVNGVTYSSSPIWVTVSPLTAVTTNLAFTGTFSATGATSYANTTSLPAGFNLVANGYFYGTITASDTTTYSFDIKATDGELQESTKTFSLTAVKVASFAMNYLVVAGGGSGAGGSTGNWLGSGGGAGGVVAGSINVVTGNTFNVTVGTGGALDSGPGRVGLNSLLVGAGSTLTALGGGAGALNYNNGGPGGSGGGAWHGSGGSGTQPGQAQTVSAGGTYTNYGFPGGGTPSSTGGGGGGATAVGGTNAAGGAGYTWPFTGLTYGGGGGAATFLGGAGGGGDGAQVGNGTPTSGAQGTDGRGGGGGGGYPSVSGAGGSGAVLLVIPSPAYPGSAPGATVTTPPASPGNTIVAFTSPGTYTV